MASLTKRQGLLGKRLAAHLLKRASYNITPTRIAAFSTKTADQAVDELFITPALTEPKGPLNHEDGTTYWLTDGPYTPPSNGGTAGRSVLFWFYNEMMNDISIRHKLTMFFKSIFISANDADWRVFDNIRLFQHHALGNIKELSKQVSLDNRMLRYLNNNVNNKWNPNENYAREFLELFTILKGAQIGDGDYTNYTEADIQQAARVLTGFRDGVFTDKNPLTGLATGYADYSRHDTGNKQFSQTFNNKVIMGATSEADMDREFQEFLDMIFDKVETGRAFVRRLYLFFVSDNISTEVEQDVIEPLALQLWTDNYEIEGVLKKLLKSVHFYDEDDSDSTNEIIGGKIKSPLELYFSTITLFDADNMNGVNSNPLNYSSYAGRVTSNLLGLMGFPEYAISVEGYPGFFKSPSFSKSWVDTSTLPMRYKTGTALLAGSTIQSIYQNLPFKVDMVQYVKDNFSSPEYANLLIDQILEVTIPETPDNYRKNYFREKLLGGLTVINWMHEWQYYIATNDDAAVRVVLEDLFETLVGSPEFQTF